MSHTGDWLRFSSAKGKQGFPFQINGLQKQLPPNHCNFTDSATAQMAWYTSTCSRKKTPNISSIFSADVYSLKCKTKHWATSAFLAGAGTWRCSVWAALFLSVLHSTFFLKDASFQLEFQQSQSVRQNSIGCLPALSLPSGWPRWTGVGAVEAEDMVTWSNLQVTDITEKFMPPPSYSIPACDQSCKRKAKSGQLQFALTQPVPWQGFKRHLHGIYLQPKEKNICRQHLKTRLL